MIPLDIPHGTTIRSLFLEVLPEWHARLVPSSAPRDPLAIAIRVLGAGNYVATVRGSDMRVVEIADDGAVRPTLWFFTTARAVETFLRDAAGSLRSVAKSAPEGGPVAMSDPRILRRAAMGSGRIELAIRDVEGERIAVVLGLGRAAQRPIAPDEPDTVVETGLGTLERMLCGALPPESALVDGDVSIRGNRLLAVQLALALAPFFPPPRA